MEQDLIQMQQICDKWAKILKIGSWKFMVQEIDNDYDSIHTQSSDGSAVILLGKHNNTTYDIEKRIVLGFLMVWAHDLVKMVDTKVAVWVVPNNSLEPIANALVELYNHQEKDTIQIHGELIRGTDGYYRLCRVYKEDINNGTR